MGTLNIGQVATVGELLEVLAECDPAAPIRLATQREWPFEWTVGAVAVAGDNCGDDTVYLGAGDQASYLSGDAREALGWAS